MTNQLERVPNLRRFNFFNYSAIVIAYKVIHEGRRDRWFWSFAGGFTLLAVAITTTTSQNKTFGSIRGFGPTAASLVALVHLLITLMALTLGARQLSSERESNTLAFLLSQPVSRSNVLWGTFIGHVATMSASVFLGFGAAGIFSTIRGNSTDALLLLRLTGLTCLLVAAMVALGVLISTATQKSSSALGFSVSVWFLMVFLGDLGLMAATVTTQLSAKTLLLLALLNPTEAFRITAVVSLGGSIDALGPAGTYAIDTFGAGIIGLTLGVLILWVAVALGLSLMIFSRRDLA